MNEEKYLELIQKQTKALKEIADSLCLISWVMPFLLLVSCVGAAR